MLKRFILPLLLMPLLLGASPETPEQVLLNLGNNYSAALNRGDVSALMALTARPFWLEGQAAAVNETRLFFEEAFPSNSRAYQVLDSDISFAELEHHAGGVWRELTMQGFKPADTRVMVIGQPNAKGEVHFLLMQRAGASWRIRGLRSCVCKKVYTAYNL